MLSSMMDPGGGLGWGCRPPSGCNFHWSKGRRKVRGEEEEKREEVGEELQEDFNPLELLAGSAPVVMIFFYHVIFFYLELLNIFA